MERAFNGISAYLFKIVIISTFWIYFWINLLIPTVNAQIPEETDLEYLPTPTKSIKSIEVIPGGILIGDYTQGNYQTDYNGVYISKDFGTTWQKSGLEKRGITNIFYYKDKIYAGTYFTVDGLRGLYRSDNGGQSWNHVGPIYGVNKIYVTEKGIFTGTFNNGLWLSGDFGETWTQIFGNGWYGSKIDFISANDRHLFFISVGKVYKVSLESLEISEIGYLGNKSITNLQADGEGGSKILAGSTTLGLFLSEDYGVTWQIPELFNLKTVRCVSKINDSYVVITDKIYKSLNNSTKFIELEDFAGSQTLDCGFIYEKNPKILILSISDGLYKKNIKPPIIYSDERFALPWIPEQPDKFVDTITAYFDHEYPFLGYSNYYEPPEYSSTTLNFLGEKESPPLLYYSSHNGIDFGLDYGTEIKAVQSGIASYYYCKDCGNSIKIDHANGIQTTYMHLQSKNILTQSVEKIPVNKNEVIGLVGLAGKTTGPHLHFNVTYDKNSDGNFNDNYPDGLYDPFGWMGNFEDPWKFYEWDDSAGSHQGVESKYMWEEDILNTNVLISGGQTDYMFSNKHLFFSNPTLFEGFSLITYDYLKPIFTDQLKQQTYINDTSFIINLIDQTGKKIHELNQIVEITLSLTNPILNKYTEGTIRAQRFDEINQTWVELATIFDTTNNTIVFETDKFSRFAVTGILSDTSPPTAIATAYDGEGWVLDTFGWLTVYPTLTLKTEDTENISDILFSLDGSSNWVSYSAPINVVSDGIILLKYFSIDTNQNIEEINEKVLKINTDGKIITKLKITEASFGT